MINIGKRLRQLRHAKGMSLGDIQKQTGIFKCYVSRVELGYITPKLPMLEKWLKALGISLHEFFSVREVRRRPTTVVRFTPYEKRLFVLLRRTDETSRRLFLFVANQMAKQRGKHG